MEAKQAVAYYRVSTDRQGESGLGLEAQQESVCYFTKHRHIKLAREFTEVESGRKKKRPVLQEAVLYCKEHKALLIIARIDRLARNVAFVSSLMESKVEFIAVDMPEANHFVVHIMAAVAEYTSQRISIDTKNSLRAAKKNGVVLGSYSKILSQRNKRASESFTRKMRPVIRKLRKQRITTVRDITNALNKNKIPTYRKNSYWHASSVHRLLVRIDRL